MPGLITSRPSKRHRGNSLVPALFVFVMCLLSLCGRAESFSSTVSDSSGTVDEKTIVPDTGKYDLNDPRNPNCPCHDAQKKADEEYRNSQLQRGQNPVDRNPVNNDANNDVVNNDQGNNDRGNNDNNGNSNSNGSDVNTNKTTFSGSGGSQKHYSASYKFQKKMKRWSKKVNRKLHSKNKGTKGGKFRVADCFHWM